MDSPDTFLSLLPCLQVSADLTTEFNSLPVQIDEASVAYPSSFRVLLASGPTTIRSGGTYTVTVAVNR